MKRNRLKMPILVSLFAALISVSAFIAIPFTVPITLQTLVIFLSLMLLGAGGLYAVLIYIALGAVGLPVFAAGGAGVGHILGASGGFIFGFILASGAFVLLRLIFGEGRARDIAYAFISLGIIYLSGVIWFVFVYGGADRMLTAVGTLLLPSVIFDIIKLLLASYLSERLKKLI